MSQKRKKGRSLGTTRSDEPASQTKAERKKANTAERAKKKKEEVKK